MLENIVVTVGNYATNALQDKLTKYAEKGYKLVSTEMARNAHGVEVMYLFFVKDNKEIET